MEAGVLYMIAKAKHAANAIVSVYSLRRWYAGPIAFACETAGLGRECAEEIAADPGLNPGDNITIIPDERVSVDRINPSRGTGSIYRAKTALPQLTPFSKTIYLDLDTLVVAPFGELWPQADEWVLTGFGWPSNGRMLRRRLDGWLAVEPERAAYSMHHPFPHVNTGIMAWDGRGGDFARDWAETCSKHPRFTDDDLAAQIVAPYHKTRNLGPAFNCSPSYNVDIYSPRIRHFHRRMNYRTEIGRHVWFETFLACLERNVANIRRWPIHRYNWRSLDFDKQRQLKTFGLEISGLPGMRPPDSEACG